MPTKRVVSNECLVASGESEGDPSLSPQVTSHKSLVTTRRAELAQHLAERHQLLAQLDAQRVQVQAAILRLEGACAVLDEIVATGESGQ
jgi:hypothetical protein